MVSALSPPENSSPRHGGQDQVILVCLADRLWRLKPAGHAPLRSFWSAAPAAGCLLGNSAAGASQIDLVTIGAGHACTEVIAQTRRDLVCLQAGRQADRRRGHK